MSPRGRVRPVGGQYEHKESFHLIELSEVCFNVFEPECTDQYQVPPRAVLRCLESVTGGGMSSQGREKVKVYIRGGEGKVNKPRFAQVQTVLPFTGHRVIRMTWPRRFPESVLKCAGEFSP